VHPEAAGRIAALVPQARLIFVLRNPVDRAFSNYWYNVSRGAQNPKQSFEEAIASADGYQRYVSKGFYADQLATYWEHFVPSQIRVILSEDMRSDPYGELAATCRFLEIQDDLVLDAPPERHATRVPKGRIVGGARQRWRMVKRRVAPLVPAAVKTPTNNLRVALAEKGTAPYTDVAAMATDTRARLADTFRDANERLAELLGRPISWD